MIQEIDRSELCWGPIYANLLTALWLRDLDLQVIRKMPWCLLALGMDQAHY